jgi:membrane-associated phospholipid phosphatase
VLSATWALALTLAWQAHVQPVAPSAPNSEWSDDKPFEHVLDNLKTDFRNLPTATNAAIIAGGALGAGLLHPSDTSFSNWAAKNGTPGYTHIGDILGDAYVQAGAAVGTYAIGRLDHNAIVTHVGSDLIRGQILNGIFTTTIKVAVNRTRPTGSNHSFPSGHSSASFTSASILQAHFGWKVGAAAYATAGFVGWCRARDNQHWLSDVAFGSALGVLSGHTVTTKHHHPGGVIIVPTHTTRETAVFVMWTPGSR